MAFDHQSSRLPGLDGLRGISILLVIMCHSVWYRHLHLSDKTAETLNEITKPLGLFGVPVFFVISGFLISYLLLREEERVGQISLSRFWTRRFLRIVPPVVIYVALTSLYLILNHLTLTMMDLTSVMLFFRNLVDGQEITNHFWSLSLEEQFYLFWPLLLFFADRRWRLRIALVLLAIFPLMRIVSVLFSPFPVNDFTLRLMRFDFILAGCVLALVWNMLGHAALDRKNGNRLFILGGILLVTAWYASYKCNVFPCFCDLNNLPRVLSQEGITILLSLGICFSMIALVTGSTQWNSIVNCRLLSGIGLISYSLYLWQQFFFFAPNLPHFIMYLPVRIVCAFGFAACSYYFIERPSAKLRQRIGQATISLKRRSLTVSRWVFVI